MVGAMAEVSARCRRRLDLLGAAGQRWLDDLDGLLAALERAWGCTIGAPLDGGTASFVAHATDRIGRAAVVKVAIPSGGEGYSGTEPELIVFALAPRGAYVDVLEVHTEHRAMLLEGLGPALVELDLDVEEQIDVLAETMTCGWRRLPDGAGSALPTGADQAAGLAEFIMRQWDSLGRPCSRAVIDRALEFVERRRVAFDPSTAVLVHGDAHPANVLVDPRATGGRAFKMIDPQGLVSEPAHDLAIPLRDWSGQLLAAGDVRRTATAWCRRLGTAARVAPGPIWEWAFVERVSTGLLLAYLGDPAAGDFLDIAEVLAPLDPPG